MSRTRRDGRPRSIAWQAWCEQDGDDAPPQDGGPIDRAARRHAHRVNRRVRRGYYDATDAAAGGTITINRRRAR